VADRLEPVDVEGFGSLVTPITEAAPTERSFTRNDAPARPPASDDGLVPLPGWDAVV
jgi:hypothetical protein